MKRVGSGDWLGRLGKRGPTVELKSEIVPWPTADIFFFAAFGAPPPVVNAILPSKIPGNFFSAPLALRLSATAFIKKNLSLPNVTGEPRRRLARSVQQHDP